MKQHNWMITVAVAVLTVFSGIAVAEDGFLMHGRVSFDTGTAMVKNASDDNWSAAVVNTLVMPGDTLWVDESGTAEVELAGGTFLRFADGSKAEVVSLPPNGYIRGWMGSFYVHRLSRSQGDFIFTTPSATVEVPADSMVRVDIEAAGAATISVRWGSARVRTDQGGEVTAVENTRVWVDPGLLPSEPTSFDRAQTDAFDDWNTDRARLLVEGVRTVPKNVTLRETTVGGYDLHRYGEWVSVDNRSYWRPTVVANYVPYRHGYWNYMPAVGHVWVDEYPFAYVTTHYGRWRHTPSYGWVWSYDNVWSPAWVASVRVGDYYAWSPVDYYNRPVVVAGSSTFTLGGVSFCSFSTSYVRQSYLYGGPRYVYAPTTVVINTFNAAPPRQVHVWNIANSRHSRPSVPFDSRYIAGERDYNPRRSIRGGQGDWIKDFAPSDRARRLEAGLGRSHFAAASSRSTSGRSMRTASAESNRVARPRQVRLGQTEQTYVARSARTKEASASTRTQFVPESARLASLTERSGSAIRSGATGRESLRNGAVPAANGTARGIGTPRDTAASRELNLRSGTTTSSRRSGSSNHESNRVALRDMESSVPSPRTSLMPERTAIRSNNGTASSRTSQPGSSSSRGSAIPSPTVRRQGTSLQRSAPAPTTSRTKRPDSTSSRNNLTPSPTIRRTAPAPAPSPGLRREGTSTQRSTPAPTTSRTTPPGTSSSRNKLTPSPTIRRTAPAPAPSPSVRRSAPTPSPSPSVRRSAPTSAPSPSVRRSAPTPTPSPSVRRSAPTPSPSPSVRRSAPSSRPSTSSRSLSAPTPSSKRSSSSRSSSRSGSLSPSSRPSLPSSRSSSSSVRRPASSSRSNLRSRR